MKFKILLWTKVAKKTILIPCCLHGDVPGTGDKGVYSEINGYDVGIFCRIDVQRSNQTGSDASGYSGWPVKIVYPAWYWLVRCRYNWKEDKTIFITIPTWNLLKLMLYNKKTKKARFLLKDKSLEKIYQFLAWKFPWVSSCSSIWDNPRPALWWTRKYSATVKLSCMTIKNIEFQIFFFN